MLLFNLAHMPVVRQQKIDFNTSNVTIQQYATNY